MSSNSTNVAIIPARGGSKGLPRKNILEFVGKPLIAWTIEQALSAEYIDRVIVSTDCKEIASIAEKFGADVPFLRPTEFANDTSTTEEVLMHACEYLQWTGAVPKAITLLQCTSPIRFPGTIDNAWLHFVKSSADSLLSTAKFHRFFWYNETTPRPSYDIDTRPRRQDLTPDRMPNVETGSIYITNFKKLLQSKNRLTGKITLFETNFYESFEIDSRFDFEFCEYLARKFLL